MQVRSMDRVRGGRERRVCERRRELRLGAPRPAVPKLQRPASFRSLPAQLPASLSPPCCSAAAPCAVPFFIYLFGHYFIFLALENAPRNLTTRRAPRDAASALPRRLRPPTPTWHHHPPKIMRAPRPTPCSTYIFLRTPKVPAVSNICSTGWCTSSICFHHMVLWYSPFRFPLPLVSLVDDDILSFDKESRFEFILNKIF